MYTNKLQHVRRNSKILAHGSCKNNPVFTVQALQPISIPLHAYNKAATGSQEFQDTSTWFMQNNSIFTVQALQSILTLNMYTNKLQLVLRNSKIPAHGSFLYLLCMEALQSTSIPLLVYNKAATGSQKFQDTCTWFMQNNSVFPVHALQSIPILYMYTNKMQHVHRNSKIPAHGSCKTILYLLCSHYNQYLPLTCIQTSCNRFSGIPRYLHMVHAKQFCLSCACITKVVHN